MADNPQNGVCKQAQAPKKGAQNGQMFMGDRMGSRDR